jgi:hypothetical protein
MIGTGKSGSARAMPSMRRPVYIGVLLAVLLGSFFLTLWQMDDGSDDALDSTDARSASKRLASQRVTNYAELIGAAREARLNLSRQIIGIVDSISRINDREVTISGWLADPEGDATPLNVMVFVAGSVVATTQTKGERVDVTRAEGLSFGSEQNVAFQVRFSCPTGNQPVVVGLGVKRQYLPLKSPPCP